MLTRDKEHLQIFDSFRTDRSLPKFRVEKREEKFNIEFGDSESMTQEEFNHRQITAASIGTVWVTGTTTVVNESAEQEKVPWYAFWRRPKTTGRTTVEEVALPELSILEFFSSVHDSVEQTKLVAERASGYEAALRLTKLSGQTALCEQLEKLLVATRAETRLLAQDVGKYVEEATIVSFVKKCQKGLQLDWICNFVRMIPPELVEKKARADRDGLFDNYCVLHYDPEGKSWAETEKEKAARKDPILFGLIEGRRRLYYIGDWTDEYCDLTMDQIADMLGKEVVKKIPKRFDTKESAR